jgi:hypothetical protein
MFARKTALFIAMCVIAACLWGCDERAERSGGSGEVDERSPSAETTPSSESPAGSDNSSDASQQYQAEMARVEAATPPKPRDFPDPEELLKHGKKVKLGHGYSYRPRHLDPFPTATPAVEGCDAKTYTSADGDVDVAIPHPPGITAKRIGPKRLLVTYKVGGGDEDCRAEILELLAEIKDDALPGIGKRFAIDDNTFGQILWTLPDPIADADTLIASSATKLTIDGVASEATTIRIRGGSGG